MADVISDFLQVHFIKLRNLYRISNRKLNFFFYTNESPLTEMKTHTSIRWWTMRGLKTMNGIDKIWLFFYDNLMVKWQPSITKDSTRYSVTGCQVQLNGSQVWTNAPEEAGNRHQLKMRSFEMWINNLYYLYYCSHLGLYSHNIFANTIFDLLW